MLTILTVLLVVVMALWAFFINDPRAKWMAFVAVLILGAIVVLSGYGYIVAERVPFR